MTVPAALEFLLGSWTGTSRLWRPWLEPSDTASVSTATVGVVARGRFMTIDYTWELEGEAQQGLLLLGLEHKAGVVHAVWVDSWHMGEKPMTCTGTADEAGVVTVLGAYAAPPGPDWGWRTVLTPNAEGGSFEIVMTNIAPDGEETPAFHNHYARHPAA